MRKLVLTFVLIFAIFGCSHEKQREVEDKSVNKKESAVVVAEKLNIPWSINYDGDTFYISERTGAVVEITNGQINRYKVFLEKPLATAAEAGLLGFILHPQEENEAFAYYTFENSDGQFNRIIIMEKREDGWHEKKVLLDRIPSGSYHHGGRLKIGPDGKLYATTGDAATDPLIAQQLDSLGGKILRMNLDGSIPDDNPFKDSYVYSYGHRNPQGLVWDENGQLYSSEHGSSAHDEVNQIEKGGNYGWPLIQGDQQAKDMKVPLFHSGNDTWAPSGMAYKDGILYVAMLRGEGVMAFDLKSGKSKKVVSGYGRIRDVFILGDELYFVTNNTDGRGHPLDEDDRLIKIPLPKEI